MLVVSNFFSAITCKILNTTCPEVWFTRTWTCSCYCVKNRGKKINFWINNIFVQLAFSDVPSKMKRRKGHFKFLLNVWRILKFLINILGACHKTAHSWKWKWSKKLLTSSYSRTRKVRESWDKTVIVVIKLHSYNRLQANCLFLFYG